MFKDKKVIVIMPAYNAAQTLRRTYDEVGFGCLATAIKYRLAKMNLAKSRLFPR